MASSNNNNSNDFYNRLDFDGPPPPAHEDSSDDETQPHPRYNAQHPQVQQPYDPHLPAVTRSPTGMDPRHRTPSPGHPLAGYQRDENLYAPQRQNTGFVSGGSTPMPDWPDDGNRLMAQPTVSFQNKQLFPELAQFAHPLEGNKKHRKLSFFLWLER